MEIKMTIVPTEGTNNQVKEFSNYVDAIEYLTSLLPEPTPEGGEEGKIEEPCHPVPTG